MIMYRETITGVAGSIEVAVLLAGSITLTVTGPSFDGGLPDGGVVIAPMALTPDQTEALVKVLNTARFASMPAAARARERLANFPASPDYTEGN
jgi:hypothetical protein